MPTYNQFKNQVLGKAYDVDGAYGAQCWDGYAYYMQWLGQNPAWCTSTGYASDIYENMATNGMQANFQLVESLKPGDIVVFKACSATPLTHVAIFDSDAGGGYGWFLGQNQRSADASGYPFTIDKIPYSATYQYAFRPTWLDEHKQESQPKPKPKPQEPVKVKDETATFESLVNGLAVRDFPSTDNSLSNVVARLDKGDTVTYDSVYTNDNKRWISYIGFSGNRRYVCIRDNTTGDVFGKAY